MLATGLPVRQAGLAVAAAFHLLLVGLYLWGRDGQTTTVEIVNRGAAYEVFIDGNQMLPLGEPRLELDAPPKGTVTLVLPPSLASLPSPSGIDSVVVTDPDGRELYLRDDFEFLDDERWQTAAGRLTTEDGVLVARDPAQPNIVILQSPGWSDYRLKVTYRNGRGGTLGVHATADGGAFYTFELNRDFPNFLDVSKDGQRTGQFYGGLVYLRGGEVARSLAAMTARFYPYALVAAGAGVAIAFAISQAGRLLPASVRLPALPRPLAALDWPAWVVVLGFAAAAFGATLYIDWRYYQLIPHVPDEVSYMFQAKLMASGHLTGPVPPVREAFYFYEPQFLYENGDRWASVYPFGHPLVLAVGALFGAIWLMPSLVGAGSVVLVYLIGRRIYGTTVGVVAAVLLAGSPFFLMQASNFMAHNTVVFLLLLSLYFLLLRERPLLFGALAGLALGLAVNSRPLDALVVAPLLGLLLLAGLLRRDGREEGKQRLAAFVAGGLVMAVALLGYNHALTGDALTSPYANSGDFAAPIGFRAGHTLDVGLRNEQAQLMSLILVLNGWPAFIGLGFVLLPFLLGTRNRWDYFCLAAALLPMSAYVLYRYSGVYEGPRYWFAALPFLLLLSARGAELAGRFIGDAATLAWRRLSRRARPAHWAGATLVYGALIVLFLEGSGGWLFGWNKTWTEYTLPLVPQEPAAARGLFGLDDRLKTLAQERGLSDALVLVRPCGFFASVSCYGSVFLENALDFEGDVVWARYMEGRNAEIVAAFPGRTVYVANWDDGGSFEPYDPAKHR